MAASKAAINTRGWRDRRVGGAPLDVCRDCPRFRNEPDMCRCYSMDADIAWCVKCGFNHKHPCQPSS